MEKSRNKREQRMICRQVPLCATDVSQRALVTVPTWSYIGMTHIYSCMYVVLIIYLVNQVVVQYLWLAKSCVHFTRKTISSVSPTVVCPGRRLSILDLPWFPPPDCLPAHRNWCRRHHYQIAARLPLSDSTMDSSDGVLLQLKCKIGAAQVLNSIE